MKLGYWGIQGIARPIRELLTYLDLEYEEVNPSSYPAWLEQKQKYMDEGFNLPNLPYILDGETRVSESTAIPVYLVEKTGNQQLLGKTSQEKVKNLVVIGVCKDLLQLYKNIFITDDYAKVLENTKEKINKFLTQLDKEVGEGDFVNSELTYSDFVLNWMYSNMKQGLTKLNSGINFENFKNLDRVVGNYRKLEKLQKIIEEQDKMSYYPPTMMKAPVN